jgi:hypothetical protein
MTTSIYDQADKFLIIADLGQLKVFRFQRAGDDPVERDHLVEMKNRGCDPDLKSISDVVTDQAGKFSRGSAAGVTGAMSHGEQHNLEGELERKAMERLAASIATVLKDASHPAWILAAPQADLKRIEAALAPCCRERLMETVGADLTKEPLAKLESRFL